MCITSPFSEARLGVRGSPRPGSCLVTELPTILPRPINGVLAFLWDGGVVDDQCTDRAAQNACVHRSQYRVVGPLRLRHEVMNRLKRRPHTRGLHARGHWAA
jgi:hypothetical protein